MNTTFESETVLGSSRCMYYWWSKQNKAVITINNILDLVTEADDLSSGEVVVPGALVEVGLEFSGFFITSGCLVVVVLGLVEGMVIIWLGWAGVDGVLTDVLYKPWKETNHEWDICSTTHGLHYFPDT